MNNSDKHNTMSNDYSPNKFSIPRELTVKSALDKRKMFTGDSITIDSISGGRHGSSFFVKNVNSKRVWTYKNHGTIYFRVGDVDVCLMRNGMFQLSGSFADLAEIAMSAHRKLYFVRTRGIWRCRLPKNYSFVLAT